MKRVKNIPFLRIKLVYKVPCRKATKMGKKSYYDDAMEGCYFGKTKTIYIAMGNFYFSSNCRVVRLLVGIRFAIVMFHELAHWFIDRFLGDRLFFHEVLHKIQNNVIDIIYYWFVNLVLRGKK